MAISQLVYKVVIMLSGTIADNRWFDVRPLLLILQGHSFHSMIDFHKAFVSFDYNGFTMQPGEHKIRILQKLLLACKIARH